MYYMSLDTKLVQVFLGSGRGSLGVYEVNLRTKTKALSCTCPGFNSRNSCKHVTFVRARISSNDGTYPLELDGDVSDEQMHDAHESNETFREFVIKYGSVEIL
jgi:uncharacterized Zn finger protein